MKIRFFLLFLLAGALLLAACSPKTATFRQVREGFRNEKTGAVYIPASDCYRSTGYFEDALAGVYTSPSGNKTSFYHLEGIDGALTDGNHIVYTVDGALPAFSELTLSGAQLCLTDALTFPLVSYSAEEADLLRNAVSGGAPLPYSKVNVGVANRYDLVFFADGLPLSYRLIYQEFSEELLIYEPLTENGEIPDLYPNVPAEKATVGNEELAVFRFGTQVLYDRTAKTCYPVRNLTSD